jgi:TPR repeat protein
MRLMNMWCLVMLLHGIPVVASADSFETERARAEELYLEGNEKEYVAIIERLSKAGDVRSQEWYGHYLWRAGENIEAEKWLKLAAETGDAAAQYRLGTFYFGITPSRPEEGKKLLELAAAQGNARAKFLLTALASPTTPPEITDGQMATDEAADFVYANVNILLFSNPAILDCYRTAPEDVDKVFGSAGNRCKALALQEYGPRIDASQLLDFSHDINGCVRSVVLRTVQVSERQLLECSARIR